ncbi:LamG-like jellyroll fold domain-containing protein [Saccharicrinis sp. FJH62]|uniref:LamG-like jellyroll fold domain-containing protein n=1 Tax=Saccharicrinis sp. FJH62 TaxID=3344657 RepID=UPI0035D3F82C
MKRNLYATRRWLNRMLFLSVSFLMGSMLFAQDITDGLQYQFKFDNEDAGVTSDAIQNAGGILQNSATLGVIDGLNALELVGGAHDVGPYMEFDPAIIQNFQTYPNFTVSMWVKINTLVTWSRLFDFGTGTTVNMFLTPRNSVTGTARFAITVGGGGAAEEVINASQPLTEGVWTHIAVTVDGAVGTIYIDGYQSGDQNTSMTLNPTNMGVALTQCYIGRSQYTADGNLDASVSDFRIYNRALSASEVEQIGSDPVLASLSQTFELTDVPENAGIDVNALDQDITLPTSFDNDVTAEWTIGDTTYIDSTGHLKDVTPQLYPVPVSLRVTFYHTVGTITRSKTKDFAVYIQPTGGLGPELIAQWDFSREKMEEDGVSIDDISGNGLVGTLKNDAWIRTIGETTQYDVLDMGKGTGYFDMSAEVGDYIYHLGEYTISVFFRVHEDYTNIGSYGNFFWSFCNTEDIYAGGGAMYFIGRDMEADIMRTDYTTQQSTGSQGNAPQGAWHHLAYVQEGTTGTVYLDGEILSQQPITYYPVSTVNKDSVNGVALTGTPFNWLGRSPYPSDAYLQNTAMYDFRLYSIPLSQDEIRLSNPFGIGLDVLTTVDDLNAAWQENDNAGFPEELNTEKDALTLGDLSAVTSDISLPAQGSIDNSISITWSVAPALITSEGVVTRPDYLDTDVKLTATLSKDGYRVDTTFTATVLANEATKYTSDLLVHFNFNPENVEGNFVTDLSEKHFVGELLRGACIDTMRGVMENYGLLKLSGDSSYFDMGDEMGKVIYGLKDAFSISVYYYINSTKTNIASNGNFLYALSNSDSSASYRNGYIFGRASYTTYAISPKRWDDGQVGTAGGAETSLGTWHHYAYVQNDTLGITYLDGQVVDSATIKLLPNATLPKSGMLGTTYNFLGRSNFEGDVYLAGAKMYDFQIFNKSLSPEEVGAMADLSASGEGDLSIAYLLADADGYINRYSPVPTGDAVQYVYKGSTLDSLVVEGDSVALLTEDVRFKWYSSSNGVDSLEMNEEIVPNTVYYASQVINNYEGTERLPVLVKTKWHTGIDRKVTAGDDLRIDTSKPGLIRILDLKGDENVHVYNLVGRQISVKNAESISVDRGIYIVKVNSQVKKVFVK